MGVDVNTSNQFEQLLAHRRIDPATVKPHTPTDPKDEYRATLFEGVAIGAVVSVLVITIVAAVLWRSQ